MRSLGERAIRCGSQLLGLPALAACLLASLWVGPAGMARAQLARDAGVGSGASSSEAPVEPNATGSSPVQSTTASAGAEESATSRVEQIHALIAGNLDVSVEPQSLFEVDLQDEPGIQVEAVRVRAMLGALEAAERRAQSVEASAPAPDKARGQRKTKAELEAAPAPPPPDGGVLSDVIAGLDPGVWSARVDLDRARLAFYQLSPQRRAELLRAHAARQQAARPQESERERREREAEAERLQKLEEARAARTETERVVAEELAQLISVEAMIESARDDFQDAYDELSARKQSVLVWQRRVREAKQAGESACDVAYDAVRGALRASRDELTRILDQMESGPSLVPELGEDSLPDIAVEVPQAEELRLRRASVAQAVQEARAEESKLQLEQATGIFEVMTSLNMERLRLLPHLSSDKRDAVTGFSLAGWEQASAEVRHLMLIFRYQRHVVGGWIVSLRTGGPRGLPIWRISLVAVPWLFLIGVFTWGRKRTAGLLRLADNRLGAIDRAERRTTPNPLRRAVRLLGKVHRPLEWALFYAASWWLLPENARGVIEVQLLSTVIVWVIGGALVVNVINAVAGGSGTTLFHDDSEQGALRLRSLRLVGRTVVVFALILTLTARLVGQGTIYSWVYSTCWFAAVPVFLVLVRWWRGVVFERIDRVRKKTRVQQWVLSNRNGWQSFFAAMIAAVQLFSLGTLRTVRVWLSGFDLARRAHAYLFKRELDRLNEGRKSQLHKPLRRELLDALDPERAFDRWLQCPADEILGRLLTRMRAARGGVVVVVGARGMGKTALVRELTERAGKAHVVSCTPDTSVDMIRSAVHLDAEDPAQMVAETSLVVLDNAHALIKPVIGGLCVFDELIGMARASCERTLWVLTLDASIWPFLKRARDARPLFDETHVLLGWEEQQIGALLHDRCRIAGVTPRYDDLLDKLPAGADEIDRLEALQAKQAGYERMLWDHVRGNPALALEAWRRSLDEDGSGAVHVRPLQVPDASALDVLPDSALFILRAVLQLAPAGVDDVAQATRLSSEQVLNAFRFGQTHGYFVEHNGRVRVSWTWLRAVVRLLERRHLLVSP